MRGFAGRAAGMAGTVVLAVSTVVLGTAVGPADAVPAASAAWHIQKTPNETMPGGDIQAMSCPSADVCTAVGSYLNSSGLNVTLAESWNGTSWRLRPTPATPGASAPELNGVSCPSASFCEAVGDSKGLYLSGDTALAQEWNGSSWQSQSLPAPAGATGTLLTGVSCVSASSCEAVGGYLTSAGVISGLADSWNGTSWSVQRVRLPAVSGGDRLEAVSCTSASFCAAVDSYYATAEMWDGTTWTARPVPFPAGLESNGFDGVSCTSASFCEAVGSYVNPHAEPSKLLLADAWNGTAWHEQPDPKLDGSTATNLNAVSCASATFCEAVGSRQDPGPVTFHAVAEVWRGSTWQVQHTTSTSATEFGGTILNGVSCPSASACTAGGGDPAWTEAWNGSSWRTQRAVRPGGATSNSLYGISCVSARSCEAVGQGTGPGLAEGWDGTSWRIQPGTLPAELLGVSCTSADFCAAVGAVFANLPAAATWNGTSWQSQPTPGEIFEGVSCAAADYCQAVGPSGAMTWNGTAWSTETLPFPSLPVTGGAYVGLSCPSATACVAVGGRTSSGAPFAASWNGTSWTLATVPVPAGATKATLTAVSCVTADSCEAVGEATATGAFAAAWNGTAWTLQPVPAPSGDFTELTGVSCTSATACTAVGSSTPDPPDARLTLAEVWNGTAWRVESTPSPNGTQDLLLGVSCAAPGACIAVGGDNDAGGTPANLAEAGN